MRTREERFWSKVDKTEDCWLWTGSNDHRAGYGRFRDAGRTRPAARVAWELEHGQPFPAGMEACHHCDNPPCVRPDHIFPGTRRDNMSDAMSKGRFVPTENAGKSRFTHCPQGHPYDEVNTYVMPSNGWRYCRTCVRDNQRRAYARSKATT